MAGRAPSNMLSRTLSELQHQLGSNSENFMSLGMEEFLKQLCASSSSSDSLPSLLRGVSWAQRAPSGDGGGSGGERAADPTAAAPGQQQGEGEGPPPVLPSELSTMRLEQVYRMVTNQQSELEAAKDMTLSQLFDSIGAHYPAPGQLPAAPPLLTAAPRGAPESSAAAAVATPAAAAGLPGGATLPPGLTLAGPFAAAAVLPPGVLPPGVPYALLPAAMALPAAAAAAAAAAATGAQPGAADPTSHQARAAAARAARQLKRKEMASAAATAAPAPAAKQLKAAPAAAPVATVFAAAAPAAALPPLQLLPPQAPAAAAAAAAAGEHDDTRDKNAKRAIKNRESAARSRARRQEHTSKLEVQVQTLKLQNRELRQKVIEVASAPPDPHAGTLDGAVLRRTRTTPLERITPL